MKHVLWSAILVAHLVVGTASAADLDSRPNIILVMVDDMGFSDLGCYGSEIETPNIDRLANAGVRFSRFYNASRCCPTRASLMTGLHPHLTGIGHMTNPPNTRNHDAGEAFPNYRGFLNRQCVTVAEVLRPSGYATLICGKWHLGMETQDQWPLQRGFDRYFGCLSGATRFFHPIEPRHMTLDNEYQVASESTTDRAFYTTDAFTDHAIRFIRETQSKDDRPFFLYLAYTAPHWPHQAHAEDVAKYVGKYRAGWDSVRKARFEKQKSLGLIPADCKLSPRPEDVPAWSSLEPNQHTKLDMRMAVYAAMIDCVDQNMGRLLNSLKETDTIDNTLILFLSDNGACAEGAPLGRGEIMDVAKRNQQNANNYGAAWAHVSSTPMRLYKHYTHEGGAATPFFMHWPAGIKAQPEWYDSPAQVIDIVPTILDVAGAEYPAMAHGNKIPPLRGVSLSPACRGQAIERATPMFSEHEDNAFIMDGDWKLVGRGVSTHDGPKENLWELYNLADDRTELDNLVDVEPDRANAMAQQWLEWSRQDRVYPKPDKKSFK